MSVAREAVPELQPDRALLAEITCGEGRSQRAAVEAEVVGLARRTVVLAGAEGLAVGVHAWAAFTLPGGPRVRPLVQATATTERGLACRFVHVFPDDRRALEAYHAGRATPQGY